MFARVLGRDTRTRCPSRLFSTSSTKRADFTHVVGANIHCKQNPLEMKLTFFQVVGAGAVGLAIARKLAERDGTSTLLIERHGAVGTETSSRNSEVRLF